MVRKRDQFWDYVEPLDGKFKCKFCDRKFAGGIPRVKSHLSGIRGCGIDICTKVPEGVRVAAAREGPNKRAKTVACSGETEESLPNMLVSKDGVMLDKLLAKFVLLNDVDVNIVRRPSFIDFVNAVAEHGTPYKLPCCSVVKTVLVPDLEKEIGEYVANVEKSWDKTGCTLISDICSDKDRCFINIFAYSIEGMVLLSTFEIHKDKLTSTFLRDIFCFVAPKIGPSNIVQHLIGNFENFEGLRKDMHISNYPHVCQVDCAAHVIHVLFENIYNQINWVRKAFDQARAVVSCIHKHDGILSLMKRFTSNWELKQSSKSKFHSNFYMLQSIMGVESELRLLVSSSEWLSFGLEEDESGIEVGEIIRSPEFWSEGKEVLHALEPIFRVLCLVDSHGATFGFFYAVVETADEAIRQIYETNVPKYVILWELFKERRDTIHPMHAAAAFLNPAYMCSEKFIENKAIKHGKDFILENLVGGEEKEKFVREMLLYQKKVSHLFTCTAMTMLRTCHPCDWWDYCGDVLPVLKKYAIRILSQPCSTSFCRQSLLAFETAQTEKREPLMPAAMDDDLYLRANALLMENFNTMKEKIRKPLDLEKLGELPDITEFRNENFTCDLLSERVPSSDGKLTHWSASARKDGGSEKHLRLHFITELPSSLLKGNEIKGGREATIHVILVDSSTGRVVRSGPLSVLQLMVTVIEGDFEEAGKNWTREFFEANEITGLQGSMPLLLGGLSVILDKGIGILGAITFNDVSSWTRSGKFRLGVKTELGCCEGIRVLEGISNAFTVEDGTTLSLTLYNAPVDADATLSLTPYNAPVNAGATQSRTTSSNDFARNVGIFGATQSLMRNVEISGATQSLTTSSEEFVRNLLASEEPPSMELRGTCSQVGNTSSVVGRSFSDEQEASCSRVSDAVSVVGPYCPGRNLRGSSVQDKD